MPDQLAPLFESRETRLSHLPDDIRSSLSTIEAANPEDPEYLDRELSSAWMGLKLGVPRSAVRNNFDQIAGKMFGPGTTAAQSYDRISKLYAPPETPEGLKEAPTPESDGEEWIDAQNIPKAPKNGFLANVRDSLSLAQTSMGKTGQQATAGAFSQAAEFLAGPPQPESSPEYRSLQEQTRQLITGEGQELAFGFGEGATNVVGLAEPEAALLSSNMARMAAIKDKQYKDWRNNESFFDARYYDQARGIADFWYELAKEADGRSGTSEEFQNSITGQIAQAGGSGFAYLGLAALGPVGSIAATESAIYGGEEAQRMETEGDAYDPTRAHLQLLASTAPQVLIERFAGPERVLGNALKETVKVAGRVRFGELLRNIGRAAVRSGIEEGITEPMQGAWSDFVASQTYDESRQLLTVESAQRRAVEAFGGFLFGSAFGGGIRTLQGFDQNMQAATMGERTLTAHDGGMMSPEEFTAMRGVKTDDQLTALAGDPEAARLLIGAVNGDQASMAEYNSRAKDAAFMDTEDHVVDGIQVGQMGGVPVARLADGSMLPLNLADPETQDFLAEWESSAVVQEQQVQAAEKEAEGERVFEQQADTETARQEEATKDEPPAFGQEARTRFPEAYQGEQMKGISADQVPVILREADGTEVPGLFNGYYGPGILSVARLTPAGWSHGVIMPGRGATVITSVPVAVEQQAEPEGTNPEPRTPAKPDRVNVGAELKRIQGAIKRGEPVEGHLRRLQERVQDRTARQSDARSRDRLRGADALREKLIRARRNEELSDGHVEFALWLIDQNPGLVEDVALSLRADGDQAAGNYSPLGQLITIFTNKTKDDTAVHEILHHAERLMPAKVQDAIRREWSTKLTEELKKSDDKRQAALGAQILAFSGDTSYRSAVTEAQVAGVLKQGDYQFANPSEYWAVNATRLLKERQKNAGWIGQARRWLQGFIERVRSAFNLPNESALLTGLAGVLDGSYAGKIPEKSFMLMSGMQAFMDPAEPVVPQDSPLQLRAERIRQKMLAAQGDLIERTARGESIPTRVARTSRFAEVAMATYTATPVVSRVSGFNLALGGRMRKLEKAIKVRRYQDISVAKRYFEGAAKMTANDGALLQRALTNGDRDMIDALNTEYGLSAAYGEAIGILDTLRSDLVATGLEVGQIANYWPRKILDLDGLMMHLHGTEAAGLVNEALIQAEKKAGRLLSQAEQEAVTNSALRGYRPRVTRRPSNTKERRTAIVDVESSKYYASFSDAALSYIERMSEAIEVRKFFGQHLKAAQVAEGEPPSIDLDQSIGGIVAEMIANGDLDAAGQKNVTEAIRSRFTMQYSGKLVSNLRNLGYLTTIGQVFSTITQGGDWVNVVYEGGVLNAIVGTAQAFTGKSTVSLKELGLDQIAEEFRDTSFLARQLGRVFKATGMNLVVRTGQRALITASIRKMRQEARKGTLSTSTKRRLAEMFPTPEDYSQAVLDLAEGVTNQSTALLAWSVLSDYHPTSLSEYPAGYLNHPWGRIFYTLKTFDMKRWDAYRKEGFSLIANGSKRQKIEGARNVLLMAGLFIAAGSGVDSLKDWLLGRSRTVGDNVYNNLWKFFMLNRYQLTRGVSDDDSLVEGGAKIAKNAPVAILNWIMPPMTWLTVPAGDIARIADKMSKDEDVGWDDLDSVRLIPGVGTPLYYRTGRGGELEEENAERESRPRSGSRRRLRY